MRENDLLVEFRSSPNYLMFLSVEISLLLLGPHISYIVLVVFEAHLRESSPIKAWCSETFACQFKRLFLHSQKLFSFVSKTVIHLVQSNPVPGAASKVGRDSKFGRCISDTIPLILHEECDERNVHLAWELQKILPQMHLYSTNTRNLQKNASILITN